MSSEKLSAFFDRPCKFKLKSGKEVYGVLWEEKDKEHFFASPVEYLEYLKSKKDTQKIDDRYITRVNINEFISAEKL